MIDIKLANKLKESGWTWAHFCSNYPSGKCECKPDPEVEELLSACGNGFIDLKKERVGEEWMWLARGAIADDKTGFKHFYGKTPTEALVHLWIGIQVSKEFTKLLNKLEE